MLSKVPSAAVIGIDAYMVDVEVDIAYGLPSFITVGLPEISVKESKERVKAAINNSGYTFPDDRITVNLAPAHIKKEGTGLDLPMAMGILGASGVVPQAAMKRLLFFGELSLDGRIKGVLGMLSMAHAAQSAGFTAVVVPYANRKEAAVVKQMKVYAPRNLAQAVEFARGAITIEAESFDPADLFAPGHCVAEDFSEVNGQEHVKRSLEIAAAGGHNLLMLGPPGAGKTMLARRLPTILPPLTFEEAIETTKIYSIMGMLNMDQSLVTQRPFRSPHHTISDAGLIGGGARPRPGEVSLAHNGVLFLDELPEYKKNVLEVLRQPMEDHAVTISRALTSLTYPASFMLIAAMNPCPCGYATDPHHECRCSNLKIMQYRSKISGPLIDRIDMHVEVPAVSYRDLSVKSAAEPSADIRQRVVAAREIQTRRYQKIKIYCNAQMASRHVRSYCRLDSTSGKLMERAVEKFGLSARAYFRVLKIARTIADLSQAPDLQTRHLFEALQYRILDRNTPAYPSIEN